MPKKALERGELDEAIAKYKVAWENWANVFNRFPAMMTDESAEEVMKAIKRYRNISDEQLGNDFVLGDFLKFREEYDTADADPRLQQILSEWSKVDRGAYFKRVAELRARPKLQPYQQSECVACLRRSRGCCHRQSGQPQAIQEPKPTEPKPTEPAPSEPKPSEPKPTEEPKAALPEPGDAPAPPAPEPAPPAPEPAPATPENPAPAPDSPAPDNPAPGSEPPPVENPPAPE